MSTSTATTSKLFQPLRIGNLTLSHRAIMAPLTRFRASDTHVPLPFVAEYYAQRASEAGTLLISEATIISPRAGGYANVPGIWSDEQIHAWKSVTEAVHQKGSYIFLQLWALGRVANPDQLKTLGDFDVVSSSTRPERSDKVVPRAMTTEEIKLCVDEYAQAARNAIDAGFDGVEIHGANGYLVDQFTQDTCNQRTDEYGGSIENRSRFGLEVAKAVVDAVGAERVGIRLSPWSTFQGMRMENPIPQFTHLIRGLKGLKLAYLHLVESRVHGIHDIESTDQIAFAIAAWGGISPVLAAGGFSPEIARKAVDEEYADRDIAVVFGRYFISTPDLPFRLRNGIEVTPYDRKTFYKPKSPQGYIDYPFSEEFQRAHKL